MVRDTGAFEYEMIRVQRKRASTLEGNEDAVDSEATTAPDEESGGADGWLVVDGVADTGTVDDPDESKSAKSKREKKKKRSGAAAANRPSPFTELLACARRLLSVCMSTQAMVAIGLAWCGVVALLLMKCLWFYKLTIKPLEKSLGKELSTEVEPVVVILVLVVPFVVTGLLFYGLRPSPLRLTSAALPPLVEKLRIWRRHVLQGRVDSVDVVVLAVFALIQVNAFVGKLMIDQYNGKIAKSGYLNRGGRALGMNGFYAVLLSIVLVSRRSFVHQFLNLSSERAAKYHVWCGNFGAFTLAAHGLIYSYIWTVDGKLAESLAPCFDCDTKRAYKSLRNFSGLFAQVILIVVAFSSLERVRRQHFRRFTFVHCLNVLFVAATCLHYYPAAYWFISPVLVYTMYRVVSVFARARSSVISVHALDDSIVQLQLRRDTVGLDSQDFVPGQYVYVKVDDISKNEWHPFTISSSPLRNRTTLSLDIKVHGPFTARLLQMARCQSLSSVQVDGYYGSGIEVSSNMVFIAGGSGMTPFLSMLEHLVILSKCQAKDENLPKRLWIVWTARDLSLLNAHKALLDQVRHSRVWKARVWLHWTGSDEEDGLIVEASTLPTTGQNVVALDSPPAPLVPHASTTMLFAATAICALAAIALVHSSPLLNSGWWVKRLSLLFAGVLGALAGGSWILWRAVPNRAGFERVDSTDAEYSGKTAALEDTGIVISRSRPDVNAILREIHSASKDVPSIDGDMRIIVSGPSELQQRVVEASVSFRAPLISVESRSFAL